VTTPLLQFRPIQVTPFPIGEILLCEPGNERIIFSGSIDSQTCARWVNAARAPSHVPKFLETGGSLISTVKRCYDVLDPDNDYEAFEALYNFRVAHDLAMYNRGVETPMIFLVQHKERGALLSFDGGDCAVSLGWNGWSA